MPDVESAPVADGAAGPVVDRRMVLAGAAAARAAAGPARPARAAGSAAPAAPQSASRFDPVLARRLQQALRERRAVPGGAEPIGHLGGTTGHRSSSAACDPSA
jgi:hypothetical protein